MDEDSENGVKSIKLCPLMGNDQIHTTSRARSMSVQKNLLDIATRSLILYILEKTNKVLPTYNHYQPCLTTKIGNKVK